MSMAWKLLLFGNITLSRGLSDDQEVKLAVLTILVFPLCILGLGALLLFRVSLEPLSFALGFSSLLVAITCERIWAFIANE